MAGTNTPHSPDGVITTIPGVGIAELYGTTVPSDGKRGYAPGCLFRKIGGNGIGSTLYVNEGSNTSCDFNAK